MLQITAVLVILAVCLLLLLLLAIPTRLQSFWNWLKALFSANTASAAVKDATSLILPWSGRICRGSFFLCCVGYFAILALLFVYFGWQDVVAELENKPVDSSRRLNDPLLFLPYTAAHAVWFGDAEVRVTVIILLAVFYLPLVFATKRMRDTNRSAWWLFFIFAPYVGGLALILTVLYLLFWPGTDGPNSFGRSPADVYQPRQSPKSSTQHRRPKKEGGKEEGSSPFMEELSKAFKSGAFAQRVVQLKPDYLPLALPLLAKIAASNGSMSARAEKLVCDGLIRSQCPDKEVALTMQSLFRQAASSPMAFQTYLALFHTKYWLDEETLRDTQNFLFDIATVDGAINTTAEDMLNQAARVFQRECPRFAKYKRDRAPKSPPRGRSSEAEHADALDLAGTISPESVEKAYRAIVQKYHPDKVAGMGELIIKTAEQQMKKINAAREYFRAKFGK